MQHSLENSPTQAHLTSELYRATATAEMLEGFADVTEQTIARYREQGFLAIRSAFTPNETASALQALLDLIAGRVPEFNHFDIEERGKDQWDALQGEARQDAVRKLMSFTPYEARLQAIAEHPALLALVTRLLNAPPERFQDMALIKPPHIGREKPWHQDCAYFNLPLQTPVVGVWIALDEATQENGCMHLLSGGHRAGPLPHFQRRDWQICDTELLNKPCVAAPLPAGGCLLFDGLLPHGTPHNHSGQRRRALQFHYRPPHTADIGEDERLAVFGGENLHRSC